MPNNISNAGAGYRGCGFGNVLQDYFACGVLTVDAEGRIAAMTPGAEQLLCLPGDPGPDLSQTTLPTAVQFIVDEVRKTGQPVADRRIVLVSNHKAAATLSVTAMPVSPDKQAGSVVVVLRDASSADHLEHEMRRLNRLASIGTLAASVAHEIKNAMVPVQTFLGLLLEKNPENELAGTVRREMERVNAIVSRMLKFSAPAKPAFTSIRLHELLDHSLRLVQHRVEGKLISLQRQFNASPDSFNGDDHQLEQAFLNLLLNAVDAMGSEGVLTVSTDVPTGDDQLELREGGNPSGFLRVRITDTGAGIPPENLGPIFEPFFTTKQDGTGLGLAVTRTIIAEHNGVIRVESQPGKGTTFMVLLPCSQAAS